MTAEPLSDNELLDAFLGQSIPGGCGHCGAVQSLHKESEGIYIMAIGHDDDCPELIYRRTGTPARQRLEALRQSWHFWHRLDPEQAATKASAELPMDLLAEAGGDPVLAFQAWRAGRLAENEILGAALAERIEDGAA